MSSSPSSWLCFTCHETGRCFKSSVAAARSTINLNEYKPLTCKCQLRELERVVQRLRHRKIVSRALGTVSCRLHHGDGGSTPQLEQRLTVRNGRDISDILLVCFHYEMLPQGDRPTRLDLRDSVDNQRRRDADGDRLEKIRRQFITANRKPFLFLFVYGEKAKSRVEETLRSKICTFTVTPLFQTMDELYTYLSTEYNMLV